MTKQNNWAYGYLEIGSHDSVKSRGQATSHPCFEKPDVSHSSLTLVYIPLIPTKERELPEKILREKPQSKTRLIHPQSLPKRLFKFLYSLPLHCQILERLITKTFSLHIHSCERLFSVLGSSQEGTNFILVNAMVKQWNSGSQKRNRFDATSLEQEGWRAQVHWVDQAWRVYCCSCILTTSSSGLLIAWRAAERFYAEGFGFLFDNTSLCCPCVCISLPLSLPFIFCCGCDFNWLRLFINSVFVHFPHTLCLS